MIVARSMHDSYLSNAWLVGDRDGGSAAIVDTGAPIEPLLEAVERHRLRVTHVFNTHEHHDHTSFNVELQERFEAPLVVPADLAHEQRVTVGDLTLTALETPGHTEQHFAFHAQVAGEAEQAVLTGDVLFRRSVGGTMGGGRDGFANLRRSIMEVLMRLPHAARVLPGHTDETTLAEEWEHNPFVRLWRGLDEEGDEPVEVAGRACILVLWAGDYDGGNKAWVRFDDGREAIVGGSSVRRGAPA